jgi:transcriptional regulator with XRE-family HTH domain
MAAAGEGPPRYRRFHRQICAGSVHDELRLHLPERVITLPQQPAPIVVPGQPSTSSLPKPPAEEQALDAVVGDNLKSERTVRGLSLDDLAREAGVSRTLLGQIEIGRATPSIGVVWKIAQALGVPFATLLSRPMARVGTTSTTREAARKLASADGRFTSRALYPMGEAGAAEFYELWLAPHSREDADAHRPGTRENLVVARGQLELKVGNDTRTLKAGDSINFSADLPHSLRRRLLDVPGDELRPLMETPPLL